MPLIGFPKVALCRYDEVCKGKETLEQIVLRAIAQGMTAIGFSARSRISFIQTHGVNPEEEACYREEIARLKQKYGDKIRIFCGIEQDAYSDSMTQGYDFVIGAVNYVCVGDAYCSVYERPHLLRRMIERQFASDTHAFLRTYFDALVSLADGRECNVVAGFDASFRWSREYALFDSRDIRYKKLLLEALDALIEKNVVFQINTGSFLEDVRASSRLYLMVLRHLAEQRGRVMLVSDVLGNTDPRRDLETAARLCRSVGIGAGCYPTPDGWCSTFL